MKEATVDDILEMGCTTLDDLVMAGMVERIPITLYARVDSETKEILDVIEQEEDRSPPCGEPPSHDPSLLTLFQSGDVCASLVDECSIGRPEGDEEEEDVEDRHVCSCAACGYSQCCGRFADAKSFVEESLASAIEGLKIAA